MDEIKNSNTNKIIIEVVFGVLFIVPIVIGISLYSKPVPPAQKPPEPLYSYPVTDWPPVEVTPIPQNRLYIMGNAYDSSMQTALVVGETVTTDSGKEVSIQGGGAFMIPVGPEIERITLNISGYKPKELNIGFGYGLANGFQQVGNVYFELDAKAFQNVNVFTQTDPADKLSKLYYTTDSGVTVKLNDDNVIDYKLSPDKRNLAYVYKDKSGNMGVNIVLLSSLKKIEVANYFGTHLKSTSEIKILEWSKNSCCVLWNAQDVRISGWASYLQYYNAKTNISGFFQNTQGGQNFEKVGRTAFSPEGDYIALEFFFIGKDGEPWEGYETMSITGSGSASEGPVGTSVLKDFYFDEQGRLCSWQHIPSFPASTQNIYTRSEIKTGTVETSYTKPSYWRN